MFAVNHNVKTALISLLNINRYFYNDDLSFHEPNKNLRRERSLMITEVHVLKCFSAIFSKTFVGKIGIEDLVVRLSIANNADKYIKMKNVLNNIILIPVIVLNYFLFPCLL